jgi:hypothetical protein
MYSLQSTKRTRNQQGSALVIAVIVLSILGALGLAALEVAELNIFTSANDRDLKEAFFYADSGLNIGHELLEENIDSLNSTLFNTNNATDWSDQTVEDFNAANYPLHIYISPPQGTYVRSGILSRDVIVGSAIQIGAGYEGAGKSAAHGGSYIDFLIRSHRDGRRNSVAEVDMGWRHIN